MWPEMVGSVLRLAVVQPSFDSQSTSLRLAACSLRTFDMVVARHERALRLAEGESQGESNGAPGRIRTCGLWLRRPTLYPAELRARTRRSGRLCLIEREPSSDNWPASRSLTGE